MKRVVIKDGTIISDGERFVGYIVVKGARIESIGRGSYSLPVDESMEVIDASGRLVIPGVIDDQVHFRDPGLTYKGDTLSESMAAAAGGVTSFMDMPNTSPATTTIAALEDKFSNAAKNSVVNYSFYFGATNENSNLLTELDIRRVCGLKLFMGSSTGNMLVDREQTLSAIFEQSPILIATHCEDEATVKENFNRIKAEYGESATATLHPIIRSAEACYRSSAKAVELATRYNARLHVLHLSSKKELSLFSKAPLAEKMITNEVCVHHLWFEQSSYATKGNMIKWNPAIKSIEDREALRAGLLNGLVDVVATDHAPHTLEEKSRPFLTAPSGGPMIQHSLLSMLELSEQGVLSAEQVVEKMCHAPAELFQIKDRGYIKAGAYADIAIVERDSWTVDKSNIRYKCGWSPMDGEQFSYRVTTTMVNGRVVYDGKDVIFDPQNSAARELEFER